MRQLSEVFLAQSTPLDSAHPGGGGADVLIVVCRGDLRSFELRGGDVVIGRGEECDIVIDDRALSRRHAILRLGPPATVQDLASTNGTQVAGITRRGGEPVVLEAGERFCAGPLAFLIIRRAVSRVGGGSSTTGDLSRVIDPSLHGATPFVRDVARSNASVLILGETGVGKELLATTIHALSERTGAMTRINCAALSESLLEGELFGHEKGAFTGAASAKIGLIEAGDHGTVFLDEIGEMSLASQARLLRVIEQREVLRLGATRPIPLDVRFVAATNRDLWADVESQRFRRDLFFRLDGVQLMVPPLRERRSQIQVLALGFLEEASKRAAKPSLRFDATALAALEAHDWPGNVRELKAVVERAVLRASGDHISPKHLAFARRTFEQARSALVPEVAPPMIADAVAASPASALAPLGLDAAQSAERARLVRALESCAGNQTRAAEQLGIARSTLATKLALYRIPRPRV